MILKGFNTHYGLELEVYDALIRTAGRNRTASAEASGAVRTLPRDIPSFTGRERELAQLASAAESGGVMGIHAVGGMAGVGKTAFAVHAAYRLTHRFPDGQIFLSLRGHTPRQQPVDPADALASLLLMTGTNAKRIPPDLEARAGLWRNRLAGRRMLLILDDAADSKQVQPLLPGVPGCLVLITSRRHLTALEDASAISLDVLPPDEACELLVRLARRPGLEPADPAVAEITRLCGYLPLAVGILARQLDHHPAWELHDLAAELTEAMDQLEFMQAEDLSVSAAFMLSYADLTKPQQRLFRRLGLHPGIDTDAYAAAALDDVSLPTAHRKLTTLYDHYLITEPAHGRYRFHDLIRAHARRLAATDPAADQGAAIHRLLDYYQHTAAIAESRLARKPRTTLIGAASLTPPAAVRGSPGSVDTLIELILPCPCFF